MRQEFEIKNGMRTQHAQGANIYMVRCGDANFMDNSGKSEVIVMLCTDL